MADRMNGVFAVPTTPYAPDGSQNLEALASGVERALAGGVDGILCLGATSEALALSPAEQQDQVRTVVQTVAGRSTVIAGCLGYLPSTVSDAVAQVKSWGADGAMITPPFFGGLEAETVITNLRDVLAAAELPVMVYNNPGATGVDLLPHHLAELTDQAAFWSVKETSGAASRIREVREALGDRVEVFVGADGIALEGFVQGATGWVAASAWLAPEQCARLWRLTREGEWAGAVELWRDLARALGQIEDSPAFISLIKQALGSLGMEQGPVRPPLPTAAPETVEAVIAALERSTQHV